MKVYFSLMPQSNAGLWSLLCGVIEGERLSKAVLSLLHHFPAQSTLQLGNHSVEKVDIPFTVWAFKWQYPPLLSHDNNTTELPLAGIEKCRLLLRPGKGNGSGEQQPVSPHNSNLNSRDFPGVQWLRLCVPNAGGHVWSLVRELRSYMVWQKKKTNHTKKTQIKLQISELKKKNSFNVYGED